MGLLLIGVLRLLVLLGGVGLIGLIGHGLLGTPIIPAANVDRSTPLTSSSVIRGSSPQSLRVWAFSGALAYRCGLGLSSHLGCAGDVGSWRMETVWCLVVLTARPTWSADSGRSCTSGALRWFSGPRPIGGWSRPLLGY